MSKKTYGAVCGIISMIAVVIFFVWGMIEKSYEHSWIIFVVSGISCAILGMINNIRSEKKENEEKTGEKGENKTE